MSLLNFNPESATIRDKHRRLAAAYARRPGHEVPVVSLAAEGLPALSVRESFDDFGRMLDRAARLANALAAGESDWPPFIDTYCTVPMVPEAFGCEVLFREGFAATARAALEDVGGVWSLKPRRPEETPTIRRMFEWTDYAQRALGAGLPFWTADVQCPFSVAAQIVRADALLAACITQPRAVHHLCRMVTDFTIGMMRRHLAQMEHPGFPGRNFPSISENIGLCIADDTPLIMLSPAMYREFASPYNAEIARAFGGAHIHSCGDYRHNLDNLLALPGVRSIQAHAGVGEFPLPETAGEDAAFNRARGKVTCLVDANEISRGDAYRGRPRDHFTEYVLPRLKCGDLTGLILEACGRGQGLDTPAECVRWTRERVATGS